ncbi:hypothetical protein PVW48_18400 [Dinoroseobacter sp. PD6]|uniref:hypothetical protein n=1 Tax=Dinoroseobacter sp. PD6 TaxID=3028384 RepID=UPI00237C2FFB|nr:hypothetical protein [Dinoroseobacter sp. PD6]MDD9718737.1 hypothetical protein [Dinoroseobacter sp. PD6]
MSDPLEKLLPACPVARVEFAAEGSRLLHLLPEYAAKGTVERCFARLFPAPVAECSTVDAAQRAMDRKLKTYPIGDLLAHRPTQATPGAPSIDMLRAWVFAGALHAIDEGDQDHTAWMFAIRTVRKLATDKDWSGERARLPSVLDVSLWQVRCSLDAWAVRERGTGNAQAGQIDNIRRHFDHLAGTPRRDVGDVTRKATKRSQSLAAELTAPRALSTDVPVLPVLDLNQHDHDNAPLVTVEEAADVAGVVWLRSNHQDVDDLIEDLMETDAPLSAITATRHLTQDEARALFRDLRKAIAHGAEPGVVMLAVSLFLGASFDTLNDLSATVPKTAGTPWWHVRGEDFGIAFAPAITSAPKPPTGGFGILINSWLATEARKVVEGAHDLDALEEQAKQWLKLRPGRRRRLSRIAQCLSAALVSAGADAAVTGLLTRQDIRTCPQVYYTRVKVAQLDQIYADYRTNWLSDTERDTAVCTLGRSSNSIGSRRVPAPETVATFFAALDHKLAEAEEGLAARRPYAVQQLHAAFVNKVAGIVAFATAMRPHGVACPPFSQMLLEGPCPSLRLQDKGNRQVDDARWLPVPSLLAETLRALRMHLENLRPWASLTSPGLAAHIDASLSGECAPLWYIPVGAEPPEVLKCSDFWKVHKPPRQERNLFRHYWRTQLVASDFPGWMLDYWMGHGGWQAAQYLPHGAYRAGDLQSIADAIDEHAADLGLHAPEVRRLPQ